MRKPIVVLLIITLLLSGCSIITPEEDLPTEKITQTMTPTTPISKSTVTPTVIDTAPELNSLTIWLSEQLDPSINTQAGEILLRRLDTFSQEYPEISIKIRIKADDGPGNLIDSLSSANAAAPGAIPDLVAFSYEDMQAAFFKGLLYPYDGLTDAMADEDWYSFTDVKDQEQAIIDRAGWVVGNKIGIVSAAAGTNNSTIQIQDRSSDASLSAYITIAWTAAGMTYYQSASGSLSFAGADSKKSSKLVAGAVTFAGAMGKKVSKALSGALSFVGDTPHVHFADVDRIDPRS